MKYVVCPDWITSANDGDRHYIGVAQLVRLYELRHNEYTIFQKGIRYPDGTKFLHPSYSGNYGRPSE